MISILTEWESRCGDVVCGIEAEIERIKTDAWKRRSKEAARASLLEQAVADVSSGDATLSKQSGFQPRTGGRRLGGGAGAGAGMSSGNKREYKADDNDDDDDGYFENGSEGVNLDSSAAGARMDIDEGVGSTRPGPAASRQTKRVLGKKS